MSDGASCSSKSVIFFVLWAILKGMQWYQIIVLSNCPLMNTTIACFSLCLIATYMSFFEMVIQIFCQFLSQVFSIFLTNMQKFCFMFQMQVICCINVNFSNSIGYFLPALWCLLMDYITYFHIASITIFFIVSVFCVLLSKFYYSNSNKKM